MKISASSYSNKYKELKDIVSERCKPLGIERFYVGTEPKLDILKQFCNEPGISLNEVACIGDDINDRDIIYNVGFSACPADAVGSIKRIVDVVLEKNGGYGCIRGFIDEHLGYHF